MEYEFPRSELTYPDIDIDVPKVVEGVDGVEYELLEEDYPFEEFLSDMAGRKGKVKMRRFSEDHSGPYDAEIVDFKVSNAEKFWKWRVLDEEADRIRKCGLKGELPIDAFYDLVFYDTDDVEVLGNEVSPRVVVAVADLHSEKNAFLSDIHSYSPKEVVMSNGSAGFLEGYHLKWG